MSGTVYGEFVYTDDECSKDACKLFEAMDGLGTNEKDIVAVLVNLRNDQRQALKDKYGQENGEDLMERLKSELSSDLENTIVALMMKPREYDAKLLHDAICGAGTDENTLIGVMCSRSPSEIEEIKEAYRTAYEKELGDDLAEDTSGYFGRMMVALAHAAREDCDADDEKAEEEAHKLVECGVNQLGTEEIEFNRVLCARSFEHLRHVFQFYENERGKTIEEDIESEMSGNLKDGYLAIVKIAKDKNSFFAERINKACKGWGTDDDELIRLIVTRSETDLADIKQKYEEMYGETLYALVDSECSSYYKQCLLSVLEGHFVDI